jgi:hypothetical protein
VADERGGDVWTTSAHIGRADRTDRLRLIAQRRWDSLPLKSTRAAFCGMQTSLAEGPWDGASSRPTNDDANSSVARRNARPICSTINEDNGDGRRSSQGADGMNARTTSLVPRDMGEYGDQNVHSIYLPSL